MGTRLNRDEIKNIRVILQDMFDNIEEGKLTSFDIKVGNASLAYSGSEITFQLKLDLKGAEKVEQIELKEFAMRHNLDTTKFDCIELDNRDFKVVGYNRRAKKNTILIECLKTGKSYMTQERIIINKTKKEVA